jgi:pilus assembly protein CpaB
MTHHQAPQQTAQQTPRAATSDVLVAAHALEPGALVKPGDLKWQAWPAESIADSYFTQKTAPQAMNDEVGAFVRTHLDSGEPVTTSKLVQAKNAGFMAAMLTPGMRAVATKISEESGAGGFILPGDHVDVILTRRIQRSEDSSGGGGYAGEILFRNIRVLAIGQDVSGGTGKDKSVTGRTATLELTPKQAERLALANAMGDITLALRSAIHGDVTAAIAPNESAGTGRSINVVRYSRASRVTPPGSESSGE